MSVALPLVRARKSRLAWASEPFFLRGEYVARNVSARQIKNLPQLRVFLPHKEIADERHVPFFSYAVAIRPVLHYKKPLHEANQLCLDPLDRAGRCRGISGPGGNGPGHPWKYG